MNLIWIYHHTLLDSMIQLGVGDDVVGESLSKLSDLGGELQLDSVIRLML